MDCQKTRGKNDLLNSPHSKTHTETHNQLWPGRTQEEINMGICLKQERGELRKEWSLNPQMDDIGLVAALRSGVTFSLDKMFR